MPWAAAAAVVAAGISANASKKASKENSRGIKKGLDQSAALAKQARADVMNIFDISSKRANQSMGAALDFYKQNAAKRLQPFIQGNQNAQNVVSLGARQANNAVLGLPVDMSFTQQPQVQADYGGIMGAQLPQFSATYADQQAAQELAAQPQVAADAVADAEAQKKAAEALKKEQNSVEYRADPRNQFKNQVNDYKTVKKFIKKIF